MLTAIRQSNQLKVVARASQKNEAPFVCPKCRHEVILRKGRIKIHHFAHKPPITCALGKGETEQHLCAKLAIFDALQTQKYVKELELEKDFGISVADIYAKISGVPVAIEIQRSALSVNEIVARTENYNRLGIAVLWAGIMNSTLLNQQYSPRAWEKWVHAAYYGRVYYWEKGQEFRVVHLDSYMIHAPYSEWHDENGDEQSAGGYGYISKRWRTPCEGKSVTLSDCFHRISRNPWSSRTIVIPTCALYIDVQPTWWSKK